MTPKSNPVTPAGYAAMKARYDHLLGTERPEIVEIVSWAAGNGDRSENGDYLYGRKKMREIDRELAFLAKVMKHAKEWGYPNPRCHAKRPSLVCHLHSGRVVRPADVHNILLPSVLWQL